MKRIVEVMMAAGVVTGVVIWYVTGAVWQFLPIALGLWVGKIARDALEKDEAAPPPEPPKKGSKK